MKTNTKLIAAVGGFSLLSLASLANAERLGDFGERHQFRERVELRIVNNSPATIENLYVAPVYRSERWGDWGSDQLGSGTLRSGYEVTTRTAPGRYNVKLVNANGRVCQFPVDLDRNRTIEIEGRDLWRCQRSS